jgi:hypothetical protein
MLSLSFRLCLVVVVVVVVVFFGAVVGIRFLDGIRDLFFDKSPLAAGRLFY